MLVPLHVHLFDHGRERSRFTSADRPRRQDQPVLITSEQLEMLGQLQFVHRAHVRIDDAKNDVYSEPLTHDTGAVTSGFVCISKIGIAALGQFPFIKFRNKAFD